MDGRVLPIFDITSAMAFAFLSLLYLSQNSSKSRVCLLCYIKADLLNLLAIASAELGVPELELI